MSGNASETSSCWNTKISEKSRINLMLVFFFSLSFLFGFPTVFIKHQCYAFCVANWVFAVMRNCYFLFFVFLLWRYFMLIKFFLLYILGLHWIFLCVDFCFIFFFHFPCCAVTGCQKDQGLSALHGLFVLPGTASRPRVSKRVCVCICSLLLAETVILFTKPVHSFIC